MQQVWTLLRKEWLIEWRSMHTLVATLLYIASTVFAIYMMTGQPDALVWNALFWIAQLFIIVNAAAKNFQQESRARFRYYYSLVAPWQFLLSKILYQLIYMLAISLLTIILFIVLLGNVLANAVLFYTIAFLGTATLSVLFTFLSAIAGQTQQGAAMATILGFPIAIPIILVVSKISVAAVSQVFLQGQFSLIATILALFVLMIVLSLILYPFLWHE